MEEYLPINGAKIKNEDLAISKAKEALEAILRSDFCKLLNVYIKEDKSEVIEFDTEVEVGQFPDFDIKPTERIAVEFSEERLSRPKVYTLRKSFPLLSHMNLEGEILPRSLCLYEQSPEEVNLFWTGFTFIERIREWLKLSAIGKLHLDDQPLEPFILDYLGNVVLSRPSKQLEKLFLYKIAEQRDRRVNFLLHKESIKGIDNFGCSLLVIQTPILTHGIIQHAPQNLFDLNQFLSHAGLKFSEMIIEHLKTLYKERPKDRVIFLVSLPKRRRDGEEASSFEHHAFLTVVDVEQICLAVGLYEKSDYGNGLVMGFNLNEELLKKINIGILRPIFEFTTMTGQLMNRVSHSIADIKIAAVGMGALGSQVFMNCVRAGFGRWVLVDHDYLWPHNLSRHALTGIIGISKSENLSALANSMVNEEISRAIVGNVVTDNQEMFENDFKNASLILDMSASPSVLKRLGSDFTFESRIISLFLNTNGSDLVLLSEDVERKVRIDHLEAQYFRALFNSESLVDHMVIDGKTVRYSNSCSDISAIIPQDRIAQHSAIASAQIKKICGRPESSISIFKIDGDTNEVAKIEVPTYETHEVKMNDWTLIYDKWFIDKIYNWREKRLPNETGGVLLGTIDMSRKRIYVIDTILSPKDSVEYPTAYVRGIEGLEESRKEIMDLTGGQVLYVGEWHSHPKGYGSQPSGDDLKLFSWLKENMTNIGMPPLMLIAGSNYDYRFLM